VRRRYAALALGAGVVLGYAIGNQPAEPVVEVISAPPEVITETVYVDREVEVPVEVIVEVPAKFPDTCKRLTEKIREFQMNLADLDGAAGKIARQSSILHRQSVARDGPGMVKTLEKIKDELDRLDDAGVAHFYLWTSYQTSVDLCEADLHR